MRYCCCVAHSRACSGGGGVGERGDDAHVDAHRVRTEDTRGETTGGTAVEILIFPYTKYEPRKCTPP